VRTPVATLTWSTASWPAFPRSLEKYTARPSAVHCGLMSRSLSFVRRRGGSPMRITQTSFRATKAMLWPSGDSTGALMPCTLRGPKLSK
jgi:hypothetical protein